MDPDKLLSQPLKAGSSATFQKPYLSPFTKEQLAKIGWQEGDPIPSNLPEHIAKIQAQLSQDKDAALVSAETQDKLDVNKALRNVVDFNQLPAENQAELMSLLNDAKVAEVAEQAAAKKEADLLSQIPATASPDVQSMMRQALQAQAAEEEAKAAAPSPPDAATATSSDPPESDAGGQLRKQNCQHCGWNLEQELLVEPNDADKRAFLASILSGSRFQKQYDLLGGNVVVTFRSLTSAESLAALKLMQEDVKANRYMSEVEYYNQLIDYRLAMSLSHVMTSGAKLIGSIDELAKYQPSQILDTESAALRALYNDMLTKALPQEPIRRIVGQKFQTFQRLLEMLEVRSSDENFWKGIASAT